MLCEKCRQREATVHKQVIINGVSHSEHLCAECAARERGGRDPFASFFHNDFFADGVFGSSLAQMLAPFFQAGQPALACAGNGGGRRRLSGMRHELGRFPAQRLSWLRRLLRSFQGCAATTHATFAQRCRRNDPCGSLCRRSCTSEREGASRVRTAARHCSGKF